jgi:anti-anti-sigma factor
MSEVVRDSGVFSIRPGQDIVATMVPQFKQEVMELLAEEPLELRLDMEGVEMMDSIGIGLLIAIH